METIITKCIRTISTGNGLDDKTEVYIKKDGIWQLNATFYQSDDLMQTKLENYIRWLKNQS
jgi:hypothetical protein